MHTVFASIYSPPCLIPLYLVLLSQILCLHHTHAYLYCYEGDIAHFHLPETMKKVDLGGCAGITGDIDKLILPTNMDYLSLICCSGIGGDVAKIKMPAGMTRLFLYVHLYRPTTC